MVSRDLVQQVDGRYDEPEVRVWIHPRTGVTRPDEPNDDFYIGVEDETFPEALGAAYAICDERPDAEDHPLIAFDGAEFLPFEFDAYTSDYKVPDVAKVDPDKLSDWPETPDSVDSPYEAVLGLPALLRVHDNRQVVLPLIIFHRGDLIDLYTALRNHSSSNPSISQIVDTLGTEAFYEQPSYPLVD
jgi:hypothetical protein